MSSEEVNRSGLFPLWQSWDFRRPQPGLWRCCIYIVSLFNTKCFPCKIIFVQIERRLDRFELGLAGTALVSAGFTDLACHCPSLMGPSVLRCVTCQIQSTNFGLPGSVSWCILACLMRIFQKNFYFIACIKGKMQVGIIIFCIAFFVYVHIYKYI